MTMDHLYFDLRGFTLKIHIFVLIFSKKEKYNTVFIVTGFFNCLTYGFFLFFFGVPHLATFIFKMFSLM